MDIWEANKIAAAYTPHPCSVTEQTRCSGTDCGIGARYSSLCDADGCDFNSYRMGNTTFLGPGEIVDTSKVFTVVTQFITAVSQMITHCPQASLIYCRTALLPEH